MTPPISSEITCWRLPSSSYAGFVPLPRMIHPVFRSYPISAKHGPVLATYPVSSASAAGGNPMKSPRLRKMMLIANPGNHPECIAQSPTRIGLTSAEIVLQVTQSDSVEADISDQMPEMSDRATAPARKRTKPIPMAFFVASLLTLYVSCIVSAAPFPDLRVMMTMAWINETTPAPIMTPWGI